MEPLSVQFCAWSDMHSAWQGLCGGNNVMCVSSALRDTKQIEYNKVLSKICFYWSLESGMRDQLSMKS